ncbi:MAG: glycosyltransferase family 39 protein [Caldilineaceae bacterium]
MLKDRFLLCVLVGYFVLASAYSFVIPLGEAPDEVSHFAYVQTLILHHQFPGQEGAASGQAHQAPLYYVVSALLTSWVPQQEFTYIANPDWELDNPATPNLLLHTRAESFPYQNATLAWHAVRLFSVFLGTVTLVFSYGLARMLFPDNQTAARITVALMAFLPSFDFLTSTVNNDNLVILLSVVTLWFFLRKYGPHPSPPLRREGIITGSTASGARAATVPSPSRGGLGWGPWFTTHDLILGLLLGLTLLAKFSAWALWVTIACAILFAPQTKSFGQRLTSLIVVYVVASLVYSPWLLYNTMVYQDPLGWARLMNSTPRIEPTTWQDWQVYGEHMFESLWGKLGGAGHIEIPRILYWLLSLLAVGGLIGWLLRLTRRSWQSKDLPNLSALVIALAFVILLLASHLRLYTVLLGADQARQVFSALPVVAALISAGLAPWLKRPGLDWLFAVAMALISAGVLYFAVTLYQPTVTTAEVAPIIAPPAADFDQQIRVLEVHYEPAQPSAGATLAITIRWQALDDLNEDYWILLKVDQQGTTVASRDSLPSAGKRTTDWWRKGEIYSSTHKLQLPADLPPGNYQLLLGMHRLGNWDWVKVNQQDVLKLGEFALP